MQVEDSGVLIQGTMSTVACPVCREPPETVSIDDGPAEIRNWPLPEYKSEGLLLEITSSLDGIERGAHFIFINTCLGKEICMHRLRCKNRIA